VGAYPSGSRKRKKGAGHGRQRCNQAIYVSWRTVGESPACNLDTKSQSEAQFQRLLHVIETYNRVAADTLTIQSLNLDRWGRPLDLNLTLDSTSPKEQIQVIGH
jgi:hypothetical protein